MTLEIITDTWHRHTRCGLQWTPCPGAEGHKPEEGTMVVGKMVTAAVTEHWVPCSVVFGSKRTGGRRKPTLSKAQLNGKLSVMAPPQIMPSSATSHHCVLGTFLTFFRYEAWRSERWSISPKGTQRPVGSQEWVAGVADSRAPGLLGPWCTNGNKRIGPLNVHSPFLPTSFTFTLSRLPYRGAVAKCWFRFSKKTPTLLSHWKQLNN